MSFPGAGLWKGQCYVISSSVVGVFVRADPVVPFALTPCRLALKLRSLAAIR